MPQPAHRALGLTDEEYADIARILDREPNEIELAMFSVMWSEHCSYKSSRSHLSRLPTEAPWVLVGPGENAGVVDVGDGIAVALRIESHNHPSAIEPGQGAATGVGGILRDIFTMGARPIALLDSLHFGPLDQPRNRWLAEGVVSGVAGYGNAVGVPTVGGEIGLRSCFSENPLVNVMCVGVLPVENLVFGRAEDEGALAVLLGSTTGRDGIGGVSVLASAGLAGVAADGAGAADGGPDADAAKRPSVQVGDPFEEKRLIEACLDLYGADLVVGIQDLGGAGLTCATSETASRGGMGMDVDVSAVSLREPSMTPAEILTSESQERMLAIVLPQHLDEVLRVCRRWEVRAVVVGRVTAGGRLRVLDRHASVLADMPARSLHDDAPRYDRPLRIPSGTAEMRADGAGRLPAPGDCGPDLLAMLCDTSWVWRQYDHQLFLNTVQGPGGDAAVLRIKAPGLPRSSKAMALTTDSNSRWCALDPRLGTSLVTAEAVLNLACGGARPLAVVNCLNFGNPEHPEVMWQLSEAIDGLADSCRALEIPVVGGNVSLYNESAGRDIDPTPVIGMLGLIDGLRRPPPGPALSGGLVLALLGEAGTDILDGSRWAETAHGHLGGSLPVIDHTLHRAVAGLVAGLVGADLLSAVHDVADGGLGLTLSEMAVGGRTGIRVSGIGGHAELFSEAPSRVVVGVAADRLAEVERRCLAAAVPLTRLGTAGGDRIVIEGLVDIDLQDAIGAWKNAIKEPMAHGSQSAMR